VHEKRREKENRAEKQTDKQTKELEEKENYVKLKQIDIRTKIQRNRKKKNV
jgi:hypothetical protein